MRARHRALPAALGVMLPRRQGTAAGCKAQGTPATWRRSRPIPPRCSSSRRTARAPTRLLGSRRSLASARRIPRRTAFWQLAVGKHPVLNPRRTVDCRTAVRSRRFASWPSEAPGIEPAACGELPNRRAKSAENFLNPLRFAGQYFDHETASTTCELATTIPSGGVSPAKIRSG